MAETQLPKITLNALAMWNKDNGKQWAFGSNWSSVGQDFETFVNKYLFPKITETTVSNIQNGNRFDWLAKEIDFIGQFSEEYVILDSVPVDLNLDADQLLLLKREYPKMATKLYAQGIVKKVKFTLNNNDTRLNWSTLADGISYALKVLQKKISDINIDEEAIMKAMLVDYSVNQTQEQRSATSLDDLVAKLQVAILNLQNNSSKFNEASKASGGSLGRYTTYTKLKDVLILTTDEVKAYMLDTKLANTFQVAGLDITNHIISFETLGGTYQTTKDVTISGQDTIAKFSAMGDYQAKIGSVIPEGSVFTFDITTLSDFKGATTEIKPKSDLFAAIFDINAIKYRRFTKGMIKPPFYNGENDETTYWLHYYTFKSISPFFNKVTIQGA